MYLIHHHVRSYSGSCSKSNCMKHTLSKQTFDRVWTQSQWCWCDNNSDHLCTLWILCLLRPWISSWTKACSSTNDHSKVLEIALPCRELQKTSWLSASSTIEAISDPWSWGEDCTFHRQTSIQRYTSQSFRFKKYTPIVQFQCSDYQHNHRRYVLSSWWSWRPQSC